MSIKEPNAIRFFIPSTIEKMDQTAEPTIEGIGGEDYLGNAVSSTDQVVNAMDGYAKRPFLASTDGVGTSFHIDTELDQREKAGFLMVDQHNLRNAYPAATKEQINQKHYTSDTYASATEITPAKEITGLLGNDQACLEFDGVNDYIDINDNTFNPYDGAYSLELVTKYVSYTGSSLATLLAKGNQILDDTYGIGGTSFGIVRFYSGDSQVNSNEDLRGNTYKHIVCVRENDGTVKMYVDSVLQDETSTSTDNINTTSHFYIGRDTQSNRYGNFCHSLIRFYNRELSQSEVTNLYQRTSISETDEWGDTTDLFADNQATSDLGKSTEGNSVASFTSSNASLSSVTSAEGFSPKYGTYMLKAATSGSPSQARQSITTVVGKTYRVSAWLRDTNVSEGALALRVGTSAGDNDLGETTAVSSNDTWTYKYVEFTATGTTTHVSVQKITSTGVNYYIDGLYGVQTGCVAEFDASGINRGDTKWYDSSTNNLDGTVTGAKYVNVPNATNDFYLAEFASEVDSQFWFTDFNADGVTGSTGVDALIGQIVIGKVYSFSSALKPEGYSGDYTFPGIIIQETDSGSFLTEEKYGKRPIFDLIFQAANQSQMNDFIEFMNVIKGRKYPFYVCFNYSDIDPVVWRVRLDDSSLGWSYSFGSDQPYTKTIRLVSDEVS